MYVLNTLFALTHLCISHNSQNMMGVGIPHCNCMGIKHLFFMRFKPKEHLMKHSGIHFTGHNNGSVTQILIMLLHHKIKYPENRLIYIRY